ncbi:aminotransferase class I/II-fold pyridoxal phosphate-dependent enzyme [Flexithrix dorotheae]|uniref:aminotransferase class I/II-fold pyridoxal phosphate-dependent enzyme n=1 Tax=Flexithrix dorotheae TaxID=70993 RepID=UPI000373738C|nr:aminotransferase class I/II-fold pyridoxal phosphate-dependent enzyme [Flexithrix dorotheae]
MENDEFNASKYFSNYHFNISQCRVDIWNDLKTKAAELTKKTSKDKDFIRLTSEIKSMLSLLAIIEPYWAFPGTINLKSLNTLYSGKSYSAFYHQIVSMVRELVSESYRKKSLDHIAKKGRRSTMREIMSKQYYYEVLFVDNLTKQGELETRAKFDEVRDVNGRFVDELVFACNFQDALIAVLFNHNIQSCVIRYDLPFKSKNNLKILKPFISQISYNHLKDHIETGMGGILGQAIKKLRPEIDLYLVSDHSITSFNDEEVKVFRRIFFRMEDLQEMHLSIKRGIADRFETPFFSAVVDYSQKPTGVFHAMPISRGNSIFKSHWARDLGDFYGRNLFLAETSATTGGLDSLLQPTGPLKKAQQLAAKAFGAQYTFFVTNGTSTSNKIVTQGLVKPDDIVLIDRECHKSHHYSMVLSGAFPIYMDGYALDEFSMFGGVPLSEIKEKLHHLKEAGQLDKVKMLILTNCTFDGIVYNVEKVMEEVLAIKPDMIFLWDEAWFGFAAFSPTYRQRTGMYVAKKLAEKYASEKYRYDYNTWKIDPDDRAMPDPDKVKIRVYSTQSTHKTLSSLRQGSMIHIYDEEFKRKAEESFHEAYMTHISTSANYQILASLDVGRRQIMFEGFELVEKSIEMAMILREKVSTHPLLKKYFDIIALGQLIPKVHRKSGLEYYYDNNEGWIQMNETWEGDEFVLDPTKITLHVGKTGVDGDTFKNRYLMDLFGIQINKTSRNTVLFMTNIGTTKSSVSYLISALINIAKKLESERNSLSRDEKTVYNNSVHGLTKDHPPLPEFSHFHNAFLPIDGSPAGNLRKAYFLAYEEENCEHLHLNECENELYSGRELVSASFVIPYPPGFPVLMPGQVVTKETVNFLNVLDVKEIHGYRADLGLRVFSQEILNPNSTQKTVEKAPVMKVGNGKEERLIKKKEVGKSKAKSTKVTGQE